MLIKKISYPIFMLVLLSLSAVFTHALNDVSISAECAVVLNADTLEVLFQKNAHERKSMASTTKIMTSLIAVESGRLIERVTVKDKIHSEGSSIGLKEGNVLTLESLVYGMLLESGNDAAEVTAEFFSESEADFCLLMNNKARKIGMENTCFETASGLDSENHYSTAYDMALLGAYAVKNPVFRRFCSEKVKTVELIEPSYKMTFYNHNKLLDSYEGVYGIKTGFTKKSGRCLVSVCKRDGITLVVVTLNSPDDWNDHMKLYELSYKEMYCANIDCSYIGKVRVYGSDKTEITVQSEADCFSYGYINNYDIETRILVPEYVYAPIKKGSVIGEVQVLSEGKIIFKTPITAREEVERIIGKEEKKLNLFDKFKAIFS